MPIDILQVREVAEAHLLALTDDAAQGRYLLISACPHYADICRVVSTSFEGDTILPSVIEGSPEAEATRDNDVHDNDLHTAGFELVPAVVYDNSKMRDLGVTEVAMEDSVTASVEALSRLGHIALRRPTAPCGQSHPWARC